MSPTPALRRLRSLLLLEGGLPIVWIALTIIVLVPVWNQRLLPMLDTPNHLALARGWHEFHDASWRIAEWYDLRIRFVPYWLFYGSIHLMLYVVPIEVANKIFLSAYLVLFPLSVLTLATTLKRSPWLALFAFPFAFNQNWIYGFASYLMSVTLALFSMSALVKYLETKRVGFALLLCATSMLCYLGHIMPWVLFGLCAIAILVLYLREWQTVVVAASVMVPSVLLAVTAVLDEQHDRTYIKDAPFSATFNDFHIAVLAFPKRVMELFPGRFDGIVLTIVLATLGSLLLWSIARPGPVAPRTSATLKIVLWILGLAYVSLPYAINKPISWWYVAPRIPSLFIVFVALAPSVQLVGWRRLAMLPVVACAVALPLKLAKLYRGFSNRNLPAIHLIEDTPRGSATLVVVRNMMRGSGSEEKSGDPATAGPVYWHFSSWPMALRGGYGPYVFDQGIPITPKKKLTQPNWGTPDTFTFRLAPEFEYYVIRDATDEMDREPSVKLVRRVGDWSLYHRIHAMTEEP